MNIRPRRLLGIATLIAGLMVAILTIIFVLIAGSIENGIYAVFNRTPLRKQTGRP